MTAKPAYEELEQELKTRRQEVEKYRQLIENLNEVLFMVDFDAKVTYVSSSIKNISGYNPEEIVGRRFTDFVHPDDLADRIHTFQKIVSGQRVTTEYRYLTKNGGMVWVMTNARPVFEGKEVVGIQGMLVDITERKQAEENLRYQKQLLETIINGTCDVLAIQYPDHTIERYNQAGYELLGLPPDKVDGRKCFELIGRDRQCYPCATQQALQCKQPVNIEKYVPELGKYLDCRSSPVIDENGDIVTIVEHLRDITRQKGIEKELRQSAQFLDNLMESIQDGISILNPDLSIRQVNRTIRNWYEQKAPLEGKKCYLAYHNRESPCDPCPSLRCLQSGVMENEEICAHTDVGLKWIEIFSYPLVNAGNHRVEGVIEFVRDITERKQAEEALRRSENYYRVIFETSASTMFILEEATTISHVNSNFEKLSGYSKQEVEGKKSWTEFIHPDDVEWMKENHYLRRRDPRVAPLSYEFRFFVRNGELRNGYLTIDMIPGTTQSVVSLIDITERKHAEQQLAESEERFSKAFRSSPAPQVISDITTGEFIDVNDRWLDMLGYAREQLIGRTSKEVGIWADPGQRDRIIQKLQENTFFNEEPVEFRTSKGSTVYALWSAERITLKGRHVLLGMLYDETERKHAGKEKEKLQAQLAQAQKMESVGRLAGGVAHDFNNKLSIINGYAELTLEMLEPEEPAFENLREIYSAGKRSANIVRQLLAFARQQTISPVRLELNDTISNMLKMLQRLIGENIDLVWHPGSNLWQIKIDPSQIDQIMANLAVNARDAIEDIGRLIIETKNVVIDEDHCRQYSYFVPGRYVMLAVSDNGCGMEKQVQDNLFEPFFTTKGVGKGTGLGLATIYGIVKQNKGFINVYSEPGQGTTFKIYLPPDEEEESGSSQHLKESAQQMPTGSETVMLVEDEPAILKMGRGMLEKLGYTVLTAEKPDDALRFAEEYEGKIHLLITDVIMPEMNGRDLAANLSDCSPGLKSIYMSGYTADVIAHHGVLDEGVHFIQKPFSIQDLAVKVRKAIEQE